MRNKILHKPANYKPFIYIFCFQKHVVLVLIIFSYQIFLFVGNIHNEKDRTVFFFLKKLFTDVFVSLSAQDTSGL